MCILNFNILFFILLVFFGTSLSRGCDSDGVACISCTEYQKCIGGYPDENIISCKNRSVCINDELKRCQIKLNCYALNECTETGIFPDAMVDSNYFVCLSDGGSGFLKYEFSCPEENFFDESSLSCTPRSSTSTEATDPSVPTTANPISSTTENPADPTSPTTVDPTTTSTPPSTTTSSPTSPLITTPSPTTSSPTSPLITTPSPTTSSPTSPLITTPSPTTSNPTSPPVTTPSPTTPPFTCPAAGIFPNPDNCKMYYRCSTSLKVFFYICPGTSYFNENLSKCSLVITPACREQILKNSTSTTTTTVTTKTTPRLITSPTSTTALTSSTTTTTTPTTTSGTTKTVPFSCVGPGTFENPLDCKTYFRCSASGEIFRYVCPGNTYFNELTKRCTLAMTPRCKNLQG